MRLISQPNRWSCLPTALAMLADVELDDVINKLGHNGAEIIFPMLPEPVCRRSFAIEEVQYITPAYGFVLVPYSPGFIYSPSVGFEHKVEFPQLISMMEKLDGLLFGNPQGKNVGHVVTWYAREGLIYDPNGTKYPADAGYFTIETFYGRYRC